MRKAFIGAFLLVLGSVLLGGTVFAEPIANAAKTFDTVLIGNDSTQPAPVSQQGTANVAVTGAVKLDPTQNTVKLGGQPIQVQQVGGAEATPFSVAQDAFSNGDTGTNCTDVTTLPTGTVVIESLDVLGFSGMEVFLFASSKYSGGGEVFGSGARVAVPLEDFPVGTDTHGHTTTALVVHDGSLASVGPGEVFRDATHPVKLCVRDNTASSSINTLWTVSGRVIG